MNSSAACPSAPILPPAPTGSHVGRARPSLGTLVRIEVAGLDDDEANAAIERGFAAIDAIHALMSFHESDSELSRLNREAAMRGIAVDARLLEVLRLAQSLSEASEGAFDVTVDPLVRIWGFGPEGRRGSLPTPQEIAATRLRVDWRQLHARTDAPALRRGRAGVTADFSSIGKGFAVDAISGLISASGLSNHFMQIAGDVKAVGAGPSGDGWPVGIETPAYVERPVARVVARIGTSETGSEHGLMNAASVPFPLHVTLCRFPRALDPSAQMKLQALVTESRRKEFVRFPIKSVALVVGRKSPYRDTKIVGEIPLRSSD